MHGAAAAENATRPIALVAKSIPSQGYEGHQQAGEAAGAGVMKILLVTITRYIATGCD